MVDGQKIIALRKKRKWKQKELAQRVEISIGYMCDIEKERTQPSVEILQRIAKVLNRKESFFLKREQGR